MFLYTSVLVFSSYFFLRFFLWEMFFPWVHWPCTLNRFWCHWLSFRLAHPNTHFAIYLVPSIRPVVYGIWFHADTATYCCIVLAPVIYALPAPSCCLPQAYGLSVIVCMLYLKWEVLFPCTCWVPLFAKCSENAASITVKLRFSISDPWKILFWQPIVRAYFNCALNNDTLSA